MSALPDRRPFVAFPAPGRAALSLEELAMCVRALDPGSRALLDLSLRRRLPLEAMAAVLHTDAFDLARRRARAIARIAAELDLEGPGVVACVRAALGQLPGDTWGVPVAPPPPAVAPAVQAEQMAMQARALMTRLRERQALAREEEAAEAAEAVAEVVVEAAAEAGPSSPFSDALTRIADEEDDEPAALPPLAQALRRAAMAEREATLKSLVPQPELAPQPEPDVEAPTQDTVESPAVEIPHAPVSVASPTGRRKIARGGLLFALLALLRFLVRR
ncbi:MAG: hypothetical protein QOJ07_626 [Thermoleophilaceae bacterium]|nr:hypothetical protein [Thermoleophilaceae bacterium]